MVKGSSYALHLSELNKSLSLVDLPAVNIVNADNQLLTEDILELVNAGIIAYTFCDDFKAKLWAKALPNIRLNQGVKLSSGQPVGWVIRPNSPLLRAALNAFSNSVKKRHPSRQYPVQ